MVIVTGTSVSCSGPSLANERRLSKERLHPSAAASLLARNDQVFTMIGKEPEENGLGKRAQGGGAK